MHFALVTLGHQEGAILPGNRIPDGRFSTEQLARFVAKGYATVVDPTPPPAEKPEGDGKPTVTWNFKEEDLAGKTVEELNMLVQERAAEMRYEDPPVFEDTATAIEFMTCGV
jgi:hypothetical protein